MRFAAMRRWRAARMPGMFLVLVLTVSVLLGTVPGPVLADDDEVQPQGAVMVAAKHGMPPGQAKKLAKWQFDDEDEAGWGQEYMAKMRAKQLIKGVGNNRFAPGAKLTYAEAVTMAVRLMGLETQAQQRTTAQLSFSNAAQLQRQYSWALGYLDVAARNGLLDRLVENGRFQANKPATRLDVVVLLVKAMGLEEEALASMDAQLDFRDVKAIPADLIGYVAVACKYGIVQGYEDGTFQPNKPVTRLQMAALLDRADWLLPPRSPYQVEGRLVAASAADSTVTLEVYQRWWPWPSWWPIRPPRPPVGPMVQGSAGVGGEAGAELTAGEATVGGELRIDVDARGNVRVMPPVEGPVVTQQEYAVSADALILLDGKPAELGDLPAGAWTRLVLNTEKVAVVVDARSAGRVPPPAPVVAELEGTVTALDTAQKTITVRTEEQNEVTVRLADQVRVRYRGQELGLDEVKVGDRVKLRLENHVVVRITIEERERQEEVEEFEGTITAVTMADGTVTLTVYGDDDEHLAAPVAANAVITYEGEPLPVEELKAGDRVELKLKDGVIVEVRVEERPEATFTARLESITFAENRWTIALKDAAGNTFTYQLSSRVQVRLGGQAVGVTALKVGDQVRVRVAGGLVYRIDILR